MKNIEVVLNKTPNATRRKGWIKTLGIVLIALLFGCGLGSAMAAVPELENKGGKVLPPTARPGGYSLAKMARLTAVFNSGDHSGTPPSTPFQMIFTSPTNNNTFDVSEDTTLYVPVLFLDDSPPIAGDFPYAAFGEDAEDSGGRGALLHYVFDENEIGADSFEVKIDGKVFSLGSDYVVGVTTPPLADGGGIHYIPVAAFVSALPKGAHTVEIDGLLDGKALIPFFPPNGLWQFSITYFVNVH